MDIEPKLFDEYDDPIVSRRDVFSRKPLREVEKKKVTIDKEAYEKEKQNFIKRLKTDESPFLAIRVFLEFINSIDGIKYYRHHSDSYFINYTTEKRKQLYFDINTKNGLSFNIKVPHVKCPKFNDIKKLTFDNISFKYFHKIFTGLYDCCNEGFSSFYDLRSKVVKIIWENEGLRPYLKNFIFYSGGPYVPEADYYLIEFYYDDFIDRKPFNPCIEFRLK